MNGGSEAESEKAKLGSLSIWLSATRPRTLPAALAPVLVGSALAAKAGAFKPSAALLCLIFALLAQIAANFANDYYDFIKGADGEKRTGPRRAVASGLVSPGTMWRATLGVCCAAFLVGLGLLPFGGWPLLVIGLASLVCAVAYTGGPYPLGYNGLGDVFVFLFFGLVAVMTTLFVQAGTVTLLSVACACALGALAVNILVANNYRDVETDALAGKRTLVVRFGKRFAKGQFIGAHLLSLLPPLLIFLHREPPPAGLFLLFLPLLLWVLGLIRKLQPGASPAVLIGILAQSSLYLAAYSLVLSLLLVWDKCWPLNSF